MGIYKKANKIRKVKKKNGIFIKKEKRKIFKKIFFFKLIRYYYTEFINTVSGLLHIIELINYNKFS